jgi:thiol-disulfide isomerase/thioredoxin
MDDAVQCDQIGVNFAVWEKDCFKFMQKLWFLVQSWIIQKVFWAKIFFVEVTIRRHVKIFGGFLNVFGHTDADVGSHFFQENELEKIVSEIRGKRNKNCWHGEQTSLYINGPSSVQALSDKLNKKIWGILIVLVFNEQTMHIKSMLHNSIATHVFPKTLYPRGIRTPALLFLRQIWCPLCLAAMPGQWQTLIPK